MFQPEERIIGLTLDRTIFLLLIAAVVALAARRLRLPYTVGLVLTGIGLTLLHVGQGAQLTPHLILEAFLPPLLFEAALQLPWRDLRREALPLLVLSTLGVLISAAVVMGGMIEFAHWPWRAALLLGVLIAATDPVSVIATFKESQVHGRVRLLVESESLFNDGVAAVLFVIALAVALGAEPLTAGTVLTQLAQTAGGGILTGLMVGGLGILLAWRTSDYLVETTLTAVVAFGSFSLAEHWGASGVLATVTAGLVTGNVGILRKNGDGATLTERGREVVLAFWDFAAFAANSLIFLLIGLDTARRSFAQLGWMALALAVALTLAGRAVSVYSLCLPFAKSKLAISLPHQHVLFWGGMRGALALALALSLPGTLGHDRDRVVLAAFAVVAFSVVVQGVTMPLLLKRLKVS